MPRELLILINALLLGLLISFGVLSWLIFIPMYKAAQDNPNNFSAGYEQARSQVRNCLNGKVDNHSTCMVFWGINNP